MRVVGVEEECVPSHAWVHHARQIMRTPNVQWDNENSNATRKYRKAQGLGVILLPT